MSSPPLNYAFYNFFYVTIPKYFIYFYIKALSEKTKKHPAKSRVPEFQFISDHCSKHPAISLTALVSSEPSALSSKHVPFLSVRTVIPMILFMLISFIMKSFLESFSKPQTAKNQLSSAVNNTGCKFHNDIRIT